MTEERRQGYSQYGERIATVEERINGVDGKVDAIVGDLKSIASDVSAIRLALAQHQGVNSAIKYGINAAFGAFGVAIGWLGLKTHL